MADKHDSDFDVSYNYEPGEGQQSMMPVDQFIPEIVKRRGWAGYKNIRKYNEEQQKNSLYLAFALQHWNMAPVDTSDPKQVEERIFWYFQLCVEQNMKPTVTGFSRALGYSRRTIDRWKNGIDRPQNYAVIEKAYDVLEELWENWMVNGQINPASGIFLGKNHFGYKDVQDVVVTPQNPLGDAVDAEAIEQKYAELPDD